MKRPIIVVIIIIIVSIIVSIISILIIIFTNITLGEVHVLGRALYSARPNCVPSEMQFLREGNVVVGLVIWQQDVLGEALDIQLILCMEGNGGGIHISDRCKSKSTFSREALLEQGVPSGSSKYFKFPPKTLH